MRATPIPIAFMSLLLVATVRAGAVDKDYKVADTAGGTADGSLTYTIEETVFLPDSPKGSWFQPRPASIPGFGKNGDEAVVLTVQRALGSDFFTGLETMRTDDLGKTWRGPTPLDQLGWRKVDDGTKVANVGVCDFQLGFHPPTGKVLGIGHTARYTRTGFAGYGFRRDTVYAVYDPRSDVWGAWTVLEFPETENDAHYFNGAHGQWTVEEDGTILLPIYRIPKGEPFCSPAVVVRCEFDGGSLVYMEEGNELHHPVPRGLYEAGLVRFQGRYYMTMRNDKKGFVATSDDGLRFGPIRTWTFDDGTDLGSYNTQQKWSVHSDALFLVYTRRGAKNDHIMRHRAPLFMAQVDPDRLCVLKQTERVVVGERGKATGNFDSTVINEDQTWITVNDRLTRIRWSKPNKTAGKGGAF